MKHKILIIIFLFIINAVFAQTQIYTDSLRAIINQQKNDTNEVSALVFLANQMEQPDSAIAYAEQGLLLSKKLSYKKGEADCLLTLGGSSGGLHNFSQSILFLLQALHIYQDMQNKVGTTESHLMLQANYREARDYKNALVHAIAGERMAEAKRLKGIITFKDVMLAPLFLAEISQTYVLMNQLDSALAFAQKAIKLTAYFKGTEWNFPVYLVATIQTMQGKYSLAMENFRSAIPMAKQNDIPNYPRDTLQIFSGISTLYKKNGELDSAIYYAKKVTDHWSAVGEAKTLLEALTNIAEVYRLKENKDSTLKFIELRDNFKDSLYNSEKVMEVQNLTFNEHWKQQEIVSAQLQYKNKVRVNVLIAGLLGLLLIAGILWRNNRHRKKSYILLQKQKTEIDQQKERVEQALLELRATQSQLIQSEKMASLGELTAGIAHEIQNPLNFVNNFSEVNSELIDELKNELNTGNKEQAISIADDIKENEQKINHHGKRADSIVKGMLQHSRSSTGVKERTDVNALADEYLRLSYHGLRAKDNSFNATMNTDFDESIGNINIIPQDIGRVLLNLYNNAFYAVNEKKKQQGGGYEPTVSVGTKKINGKSDSPDSYRDRIEIRVTDNGNGIPPKVSDKIFQPFFTTKPTGQGTGLGLSLSYDIVKAHGGEIKVETKEGENTIFILLLPV